MARRREASGGESGCGCLIMVLLGIGVADVVLTGIGNGFEALGKGLAGLYGGVVGFVSGLIESVNELDTIWRLAILMCAVVIALLIITGCAKALSRRLERKRAEAEIRDAVYEALCDANYISVYRCEPLIDVAPYDYEYVIAGFLERHRFTSATVTQKSGDYGADVIATDCNGIKWCVQCKMYNNVVGVKPVQEVVAALGYYGCQRAMVVCTSGYTEQAEALARANDVKLVVFSDRV